MFSFVQPRHVAHKQTFTVFHSHQPSQVAGRLSCSFFRNVQALAGETPSDVGIVRHGDNRASVQFFASSKEIMIDINFFWGRDGHRASFIVGTNREKAFLARMVRELKVQVATVLEGKLICIERGQRPKPRRRK